VSCVSNLAAVMAVTLGIQNKTRTRTSSKDCCFYRAPQIRCNRAIQRVFHQRCGNLFYVWKWPMRVTIMLRNRRTKNVQASRHCGSFGPSGHT